MEEKLSLDYTSSPSWDLATETEDNFELWEFGLL